MSTHRYWSPTRINKLITLYNSGLSMREVGEYFNKSTWSIRSIMNRHNIQRRTSYHARQLQFNKSPLSFHVKTNLTEKEYALKVAGLMLYWAEGGKRNASSIDFANSDPNMQKVFLTFLIKIYNIKPSKLRILLYCYPSHNTQHLTQYWSQLLNIPQSQFTKPYIRKDGGNIRDKMIYGLIHIKYHDKRLLKQVMSDIISYTDQLLGW